MCIHTYIDRAAARALKSNFAAQFVARNTSEPIATISDPPARDADRKRCRHSPPERQHEIGNQPQRSENDPEHFPLHSPILAGMFAARDQSCCLFFPSIPASSHFFSTLTKYGFRSWKTTPMPAPGCSYATVTCASKKVSSAKIFTNKGVPAAKGEAVCKKQPFRL